MKNNVGLIWLAVMWENLARNIANNWYTISVFNRSTDKVESFISQWYNPNLYWTYSIQEFIESLEKPRKIIIMVKSWNPVDQTIESLKPYLEEWDTIVDAGNSFYKDSIERYESLQKDWINFLWMWVSWGEEWALKWPSIMPWGSFKSYEQFKNILNDISADDFQWWKCVSYIWENWSGHFVKMVHNGIEYAIMQMIAEWYDILRKVYKLEAKEISKIFEKFNQWKLNSYLFEIATEVLSKEDDFNSWEYLINNILDKAWAKWTWLWTSKEWLDTWVCVNSISAAVDARNLSWEKEKREKLSKIYNFNWNWKTIELDNFIEILEESLYSWMLIAYAQGLDLIQKASEENSWNINISEVTRIWQGWCIIRAKLLEFLTNVFKNNKNFETILELDEISWEIKSSISSYQELIQIANENKLSVLALSNAINYIYSLADPESSANLIQWLRDYFGSHTYKRKDKDWVFHTQWN